VYRGSAAASRPAFRRAALWTVLGALIPGVGLIAAGRRRPGTMILAAFLLLMVAVGWLATAGRQVALHWSLDPNALLAISVAAAALGIAAALLVVGTYLALEPSRLSTLQRLGGISLVAVLGLAVAAPSVAVVQLADAQRDLVRNVFAEGQSATLDPGAEGLDPGADGPVEGQREPFAGRDRINILLLGGDGGAGRDGVRTDSVIVASVDVATGTTTLFSLPRNLEKLPFPAGSPLRRIFPDGFDAGTEDESLLNAVYRNGPRLYPDAIGPSDDLGADFLKLGVGDALGLEIDYYLLVNLDGFSRLIDSLGGITVDVNYYVPVGGDPGKERLPDAYIAPGPAQPMDGETALAFARARYGTSDYQRMDRQRCVINDIVEAADPLTLPLRYRELAATTQDIVSTDVPQGVLDDMVDLALRVKDAPVRSVVFDTSLIDPAYPDYDEIRMLVRQGLATPVTPTDEATSSMSPTASTGPVPTTARTSSPSPSTSSAPLDDTADACDYDPVQARAALADGQPPVFGD